MSTRLFFGKTSFIALVILALCASLSFARGGGGHGGGGGFGGGHGGGFGGGFRGGSFGGGGYRSGGYWGGSGVARSGTLGSYAPSHAWSGGQFAHGGNYGRYGNWAGSHNWDHYYGRGWGGWGGWGGGGYWPWFGWGLGWGYPYSYSYYPDDDGYYYTYAPADYGTEGTVADSTTVAPQQPIQPETAQSTSLDQPGAGEGLQYYSEARAAFLQGDYPNALRLAGHAAVESPRNAKVHELISLALFATGKYTAAANEAHAAMALGGIADWNDLYAYYNDAQKYTTQLRALEKAAADNPKAAADHFLLGYHYLMIGGA